MRVFLLLALTEASWGCPSACSCSLGAVDCSRRGLVSVPRNLPSSATSLDISGNDIERLSVSSFQNSSLIVALDASDNRIRHVDSAIFSILNLTVLNLRKNRLSSVPTGFSHLERLDLSANSLAALSTSDISSLARIRVVDVSRNRISEIAVATAKNAILQRLDLASNGLRHLPPSVFSSFTFLFSLRLSRNKLTSLDRHSLKGLVRLETLELGRNQLSSIPALAFEDLGSLRHMNLFRNRLETLEDGMFFGCHSITSLNLTTNRLVNITEGWLFGLSGIQTLDLSHNVISSFDPAVWSQTTGLRWLSLDHNHLTSLHSGSFRHLPLLQHLSLSDNRLMNIHKTAMTGLDRLDSLDLSGNSLAMCVEDGAVLSNTSLPFLRFLHFSRNELKVVPSRAFSRFPALEELDLSGNPIATLHPSAFEPLRLRKLQLHTSSLLCDCLVSWFPGWLYSSGLDRSSVTAVCTHPPPLRHIPLVNIDQGNLTCEDDSPRARIVLHPASSVAIHNSVAEFFCHGYGLEPLTVEWRKMENGRPRSLQNERGIAIETSRANVFNDTITGHERVESVLRLDSVSLSDSGDYQCVVSNSFAKEYSVKAELQVHQPPTFMLEPDDISILVGLNTKISCAATGVPTPVLRWSKDGGQAFPAATERRLHVRQGDDHLYILNVTTADQGVYTCHATNSVGHAQASATLRVFQHGFRSLLSDTAASEGEALVLECLADVSQQRIVWKKDGQPLETDARLQLKAFDQVLVISRVSSSDAGIYECELWAASDLLARQTARVSIGSAMVVPSEAAQTILQADDSKRWLPVAIFGILLCFAVAGLSWSLVHWRRATRPVAV